MVQRHRQDYDWRSQPIDPQAAYASAGGQTHGRLGIFDSTIDSRELRRRGRQSTSSSSQSYRSRSSAQEIEIAVLRQQADYHQSVLRQQMEYQRQQAEYQKKKDEYYSNLLAQNQALLSQLAQQADVPMPTYRMPPPHLALMRPMLSPPPPPKFPMGFETPTVSVAAPGDVFGQDDASTSWVNNIFNTQSLVG
ncbi:uncharacterized protein [Zea mays]|uniref:uncharacterized protein n=1 Tax=Zea mays TaxID=4577 RepID=UPI0009AA2ACE|nr:uncharacterized protein LOC109945282 [Zea mays]XP_035822202.1 uncharacterized protein LOC109945282 [Zea mays]|eukprot:XP_020406717.1 uncharacterized protein LOC109945282 [Zea mays]